MEGFILGWVFSGFWAILLVPVFLVKNAFSMPFD